MVPSTPAGKIILALKQQLKAKGLHYRDLASRLNVSESTVKRYFSGRGDSINFFEKVANAVDLDLLTLVELAQQQSITPPLLNKAQEVALRKTPFMFAVYFCLIFGFTPEQIAREFDLAGQIEGILQKLVTVGLIRRLTKNGVKVLAMPLMGDKTANYVTAYKIETVRRFLSELNLQSKEIEWLYGAVRLSPASMTRVKSMMKNFLIEVYAISRSEIDLPPSDTEWYRLFVGAEPTTRNKLLRQG